MSARFDFKRYEVVDTTTIDYPLPIDGSPKLVLAPATEANKPFLNAQLAYANSRGARSMRKVTSNKIEEAREKDRELYALHVVKGWKGVQDTDEKEVPFDSENCLEFLKALPDWIFDEVRAVASEPQSFTELDREGLAGN
jgi:hypothetical protein